VAQVEAQAIAARADNIVMVSPLDLDEEIRRIVAEHARIDLDVSALGRESDLYAAGMTSHASVSVMLALEDAFDVEFPEHMLTPGVFQSIASMSAAVGELQSGAGPSGALSRPGSQQSVA
jgi:acyl carrier protein